MYGKALEIEPMRVSKLPKGKEYMKKEVCDSGNYFAQIKKDGYWYMFEKDIDGNCFLFSRRVSKKTGHLTEKSENVPHIVKYLDEKLPNGTILIGEIYYPNKTSKDVTKIMGCKADKAIARQNGEYGLIHYYVHDILQYNGELLLDKCNLVRFRTLAYAFEKHNIYKNEYVRLCDVYFNDLNFLIDKAISEGEEGAVLKKKNGFYIPGKKPTWNWIKFKCEDEADVICMGFEPPTVEYTGKDLDDWLYWKSEDGSKLRIPDIEEHRWEVEKDYGKLTPITYPYYEGWIGAIKMGVLKDGKLTQIGTVSSGLTMELLDEIKKDQDNYYMEPMSVKCMMVGDGALRHPVFVRFRDDLNPEDCTWDKIFS